MSAETYGVLAEFADAHELLQAVCHAQTAGLWRLEAYTPYAVEGLAEQLGPVPKRLPAWVFVAGLLGGVGGYGLQWYSAVYDYPILVGGRPLHSWPAFIPATFELAVLGAALAAFFGMLVLNGLPRLHHPLFALPEFSLASRNGFFLCARTASPEDLERARAVLSSTAPLRLMDVPA